MPCFRHFVKQQHQRDIFFLSLFVPFIKRQENSTQTHPASTWRWCGSGTNSIVATTAGVGSAMSALGLAGCISTFLATFFASCFFAPGNLEPVVVVWLAFQSRWTCPAETPDLPDPLHVPLPCRMCAPQVTQRCSAGHICDACQLYYSSSSSSFSSSTSIIRKSGGASSKSSLRVDGSCQKQIQSLKPPLDG